KAEFMIQNILPAIIAGHIQGASNEDIKAGLSTFIPSPNQTPGRLNFFEFKKFNVLLDFAHNAAGMRALKKLTDTMECTVKVGIIAGIGDRRVEDNNAIGEVAASMFDEIIIRQDKNLRGKTDLEIIQMLEDGIRKTAPDKPITIIPNEREAITYAIENGREGSLIILCSDIIPEALNIVKELKDKDFNS
ncbi:MAG: cyanophycin synthetase, partial [Flavobacteriia bacterium]|nr:cyanophycin synthetase [Flavobacteriia bacterium]